MTEIFSFSWLGNQNPYLDQPVVSNCGSVVIGCFGGASSSGGTKNEDGALVWVEESGEWEFSMILDAHKSADSASLMLRTITIEKKAIRSCLSMPIGEAFAQLQQFLISRFMSPAFRTRCRFTEGEASCLITARKDRFLWWLSIGDCQVYLFHPELARLGQFSLNQRNYYEWIGAANTFDLPVACYSSGVRELRGGRNQIVLVTDGVTESGDSHYSRTENLYQEYLDNNRKTESFVQTVLARVQAEQGKDSATMIAWTYFNSVGGLRST
jgi:hypothetical protein